MTAPDVYTVAEVAKLLRVSPMTVYRLVETEQVYSYRIGRLVRIPRSGLAKYLREIGRGVA